MVIVINVQEAKTRLSELLRRVEAGDSVVIARAGTPIARLEAVSPPERSFNAPLLPGLAPIDASALLEPLDEEELEEWETSHPQDPLTKNAT